MKIRLIIILISVFSFNAFAQIRTGISAYNFRQDMYFGGSFGPNMFLADGFSEYKFRDCYGFSESLFLGYNISEKIGLRASAGFSNMNWPAFSRNITSKKFQTQSIALEMAYNLSNQFDIYNLNRKMDISVFAGTGLITREKSTFNDEYMGLFIKGGMQADVRLNFKLDLIINGSLNIAGESFNELSFGRPYEIIPELKIGITYHWRTNRRFR